MLFEDGLIYEKFELYLPENTKITKEKNGLVINANDLIISFKFNFTPYGYNFKNGSDNFSKYYLKHNNYDHIKYYKNSIEVSIYVKFKGLLSLLRKKYDWVESFPLYVFDYFDFNKFLDDIDWNSNDTSIILNSNDYKFTDIKLSEFTFDMLKNKQYDYLINYIEYLFKNHEEIKENEDVYFILLVNLSLAYKYSNNEAKAINTISCVDFDETKSKFKLARLIITNKLDEAIDMLLNDNEIKEYMEYDYLIEWPLFTLLQNHPKYKKVENKYKKESSGSVIKLTKKT